MTLDITGTDVNYAARAVKVSKIYGEGDAAVRALDSVTVGFPTGRFTAIMGPSGSGKSTLMHCQAGLDLVSSGNVYLGQTDLSSLDDKALTQLRRDQVGFIFQAFNLLPTLTALENIRLPLDLAGRKPDQTWLDQVIETVGLRPRLTHLPTELSGGQQQRVAVARALATRPKIVFADEPTGTLADTFANLFAEVNGKTAAQIRSTQKLSPQDPAEPDRGPVPASLLDAVRKAPGVAEAGGYVSSRAAIVGKDGKLVGGQAP